jgi:hypothetical protein
LRRKGSRPVLHAVYALAFLIIFLGAYRDFFFGGRVFYERDSTLVEIPARKLTTQLLKEGDFALWSDAHGNGQPFLANLKNAVFYPTTRLYLILPFFTAFRLHYLIHVILIWLGLYALCGSYALSKRASFLGASLFVFSGMYLSSFEFYNHIAALAWMPWILRLLKTKALSRMCRLALVTALWVLMILAGAPEIVLIAFFLAVAQAFFRAGEWKKELGTAVLSISLACLVSAAQILPSIELLKETARTEQSSTWPLELVQLPNVVFPNVLGNDRGAGHDDFWGSHLFDRQYPLYYSLYMGFGAILLFLAALGKPRDRTRTGLLISLAIFFLFSCGSRSPFFFLYRLVPILSSIRYPVKFLLGAVFCLSLLAAMGFDRITKNAFGRKRNPIPWITAAGLALVLFWFLKPPVLRGLNGILLIDKKSSMRELGTSISTGLVGLLIYAAALGLLSVSKNRSRLLGWVLLGAVILDPVYQNRDINPTVPASFFDRPPILEELNPPLVLWRDEMNAPFLREKAGNGLDSMAFFRQSLYPFTAMGDGVRYVMNPDYCGTYTKRFKALTEAVLRLSPADRGRILEALACNVHIKGDSESSLVIERVPGGPSSPYVVFAAVRTGGLEDKIRLLTTGAFDPGRQAVTEVETGLPGDLRVPKDQTGEIATKRISQGFGLYSADLPREGILVFPGNYDPGWRAWVDGRRVGIFEVNLFSKGVRVPGGRHEVRIRYLPSSFLWGAAISLMSICLALAGLAARMLLRKKLRRQASYRA